MKMKEKRRKKKKRKERVLLPLLREREGTRNNYTPHLPLADNK